MSWLDAINASMGRAQDTTYDLSQVAMGNWQGPADGNNLPANALLSANGNSPLTSAINGAVLTSAL